MTINLATDNLVLKNNRIEWAFISHIVIQHILVSEGSLSASKQSASEDDISTIIILLSSQSFLKYGLSLVFEAISKSNLYVRSNILAPINLMRNYLQLKCTFFIYIDLTGP